MSITVVHWNAPSQIAPTFHQDIAGVRFAYRRFGAVGDVPLVFLHDFAGLTMFAVALFTVFLIDSLFTRLLHLRTERVTA